MTDDHVRRFNLSQAQPHKAFQLNADAPIVKTKDNTQPTIPPPRLLFLPQPTLAPPGMMGSRLAADAGKWMDEKRLARQDERQPFKEWDHSRNRSRGWER